MSVVHMSHRAPPPGGAGIGPLVVGALAQPSPNSTEPSEDAFENLVPALLQCFGVIFLGYFAGRINLLTQNQGRGIGAFVSSFAMPALLFKSMVELHFSDVNWFFLLAIFIAKSVVFLTTAVLTLLIVRPTHWGKMGIYGIFTTQSHDFALGIPIVQALYSKSHPEFEKYLYLIAPISVAFLNPIGFLLLEVERWRHGQGSSPQRDGMVLCQVIARVLTNPIVFMTLFGIAGNLLLNQKIPYLLDSLLIVLKDAFPATALFCLGLSMVGRITSQGGPTDFITPALLIAAKMLVSPFLVRELVTVVTEAGNGTETDSLSTYGFLYGAFPTAPSVFIYASQYATQAEMMATGMVVSTFLSAPLMFISARMITLSEVTRDSFDSLLNATSFDVSLISLIGCLWVIAVFVVHRRSGTLPHKFTTGLLISQILVAVGIILWGSLDMSVPWQHYVHFVVFFVGVLSSRMWMAGIAITLCLLRVRSLCYVLRIHGWIALSCILLPMLMCGVLLIAMRRDITAVSPAFQYGKAQQIVVILCLLFMCCITIVSLILQHRWKPSCLLQASGDCPQEVMSAETEPLMPDSNDDSEGSMNNAQVIHNPVVGSPQRVSAPQRITATGRTRGVRTTRRQKSVKESCDACTDCGTCGTSASTAPGSPNGLAVANIEDLVPDIIVRSGRRRGESQSSDTDAASPRCVLDNTCSVEQRTRCAELLRGYNSFKLQLEEEDGEQLALLEERDEFQMTRHITLVLLLLMSTCVGLFLNMWRLLNESKTGVYIEIEFLDNVFAFGQGLFTFAVFGLDSQMVMEPLFKRLKQWVGRRCPHVAAWWQRPKVHVLKLEDLPAPILSTCAKFLNYHRDRCVLDVVRDRSRGVHTYRAAFTGRNLIDWLLEVGLATDRGEGLVYGRHLLAGGVIEHLNNEHHFFDLPYLYRFTDSPPEPAASRSHITRSVHHV